MHIKLILTLLFASLLLPLSFAQAQTKTRPAKATQQQHKIVYDFTAADTAQHTGLMRQLNNIKRGWPDAQVEVVVHGNAINMLVAGQSAQAAAIKALQGKGVVFAACENSMQRVKVDKSQLLPNVLTVPMGIGEIVLKQEEGYRYIKF